MMDLRPIRMIEELAANAWRPTIEQHLGGWRLRFTGGNSRRANSVWPNAAPGVDSIEQALAIAEGFYQRRSASPCFQLCPVVYPLELPRILAARGYTPRMPTAVHVQSNRQLLTQAGAQDGKVFCSSQLTEEWFDVYTSAAGYAAESIPIRRGILSRIGPPAQFIWLEKDGEPAAAGLGVLERGWLGVFCVVTSPDFRQQGCAHGVMRALAEWGLAQGAGQVYLQVEESNQPALNLYDKLGFKRLYQYHYAVKEGADA